MSGTNYIASNWRTPENSNSSKNDNYSLSFNGSSDFVSCGNDPQIQLTGDISISVWFKTTSTDVMIIAAKRDSNLASSLGWQLYCSGGSVLFLVTRSGTTTTNVTVGTNVADGAWHHVLCTINQASNISIILDNQAEAVSSLPAGTFIDSGTELRIGYNQVGATDYYFNGEISEVALFDYLILRASTLYGDATSGAGNPMALKPTPVGYWPLGDNSASDPLAQPNVAVNDASVFEFDGTNYINCGEISPLFEYFPIGTAKDNSWSASMWVKGTGTNKGFFEIPYKEINSLYARSFGFVLGASYLYFGGKFADIKIKESGTTAYNSSGWNHIVMTFDGVDYTALSSYTLYVGGVSIGIELIPTNIGDFLTKNISIGVAGSSGGNTYYWDGNISGVSLFDVELSASDITAIYNSGVPGDISSLNPLAWYKLDQSANWEADTTGDWQIPDAVSEFPQSFDFDGTNDLINCGNSIFNSETALSISAWVKPTSYGGAAAESFVSTDAASPRGFYLGLYNAQNFRFAFTTNGANLTAINTANGTVDLNVWQHILVTWDQVNLKLYKNGDLLNTVPTTFASNGTFTTTNDLLIGVRQSPNVGLFPGKISNVQIWDVAFDQPKVTTLYNGGTPTLTPPNQSDLKGWWKLDDTAIWRGDTFYGTAINNWLFENPTITASTTESFQLSGAYQNPPASYEGFSPSSTAVSGSLLLSFWLKTTDITKNLYPYNFNSRSVYMSFDDILFYGDSATDYVIFNSAKKLDYAWHHYIIYIPNTPTFSGNDVRCWVDGNESLDRSVIGSNFSAKTDIVSMHEQGVGPANHVLSNWSYFEDLTPSAANIATLYNGGTPGNLSSLNPSVWYKLDSTDITFNTSGAYELQIQDSSTNNNNATGPYDWGNTITTRPRILTNDNVQAGSAVSSGMTEQSLVNNNVSTLNGESSGMTSGNLVLSDLTRNLPYENYSLQFDGTADYINLSTRTPNMTNFTLSFWLIWGGGNYKTIVGSDVANQGGLLYAIVYEGGVIKYIDSSSGWTSLSNSITDGNWHHIAISYDDATNTLKGYQNGSLVTTLNPDYSTRSTNAHSFKQIGARLSGSTFNQKLNGIAFWNTDLSSTEVQNLYANGIPQDLTTFTPQPVSWWTLGKESFWDGSDWVIRDMIGTNDGLSDNMGGNELKGDAPRSQANGVGTNIAVPTDLEGNAGWSDKNGYSINMGPLARTTDTP
jgi:hypothetical protein